MRVLSLFCCLMLSSVLWAAPNLFEIFRATNDALPMHDIARTGVPTHIVRMNVDLRGRRVACEQAIDALGKILVRPLQSERFIFSVVGLCVFEQRGDEFASGFLIRAEIDPIDDDAARFLKEFVADRNSMDFFGRRFSIEEAEGLVVSLAAEIGIKDIDHGWAFRRLKRVAMMHYFPTYFDVVTNFYVDTESSFVSQDPERVLPYYKRWFDLAPTEEFARLLREANYIELPVQLAYLMKSGERVYFPPWSATFFNKCYFFENKHCL